MLKKLLKPSRGPTRSCEVWSQLSACQVVPCGLRLSEGVAAKPPVRGTCQRHMCSILTKRTRGVPPPASGTISTQISAVYVIVVEFHTLTCK